MIPPPSLQIELRRRVTLIFVLLMTKLIIFSPCPIDHMCRFAVKSMYDFSSFCRFIYL